MATYTPKSVCWRISIFYAISIAVLLLIMTRAPWITHYLPVRAPDELFATPTGSLFSAPQGSEPTAPDNSEVDSPIKLLVFLLLSFSCSIAVAIPVAHVFMGTRPMKKRDKSVVRMIILLPVAITGLVLIVQDSLALAFSLAGIVAGAGIRFRTQVREITDTLFLLIVIAIGLASGVGSLGLAVLMSMVFCYATLIVHVIDPGVRDEPSPAAPKEPSTAIEP